MNNKDNTREAEDILKRISSELERQDIPEAKLIAYLDLPRGTYSSWKLGRSRYFCEHLGAIAEFLNVDAGWLVTGKESEGAINQREQELLGMFRELDAEKQNAVLQNIKWLAE